MSAEQPKGKMITLKLDVAKIDKKHFYQGKKKTYLNLLLFERASEYGDTHVVVQSVSKEAKEAGIRGNIVGNGRFIGERTNPDYTPKGHSNQTESTVVDDVDDDDLPF